MAGSVSAAEVEGRRRRCWRRVLTTAFRSRLPRVELLLVVDDWNFGKGNAQPLNTG